MLSETKLLPESAPAPAPTSPEAAWRGVLTGRYRISGWHDRGGRRYVVAEPHSANDDAMLTARQRRLLAMRLHGTALKVMAMEHGLSIGTVSRDLALAMDRLGLASVSDLAAVMGMSVAEHEGGFELFACPRGLTVAPLDAEGALVFSFPLCTTSTLPPELSPAEREVVEGILAGLQTREIAEQRGVSPRTVANQIARIFVKLRVDSRLTLVLCVRGGAGAARRSGVDA